MVFLENGTWYVRFQVGGNRVRKAIKEARTKKQAERAEQVLRNELFERRWGETGQRNFADFVEKIYKPHARQHKKGFNVERSVLNAILDSFGKTRLGDIGPKDVLQFQQYRAAETTTRGRTRSRATVNRDVAVLSSIFKLASRLGEVKGNPVNKIQYFSNLPKRDRVLSDDEEVLLLYGLKSDADMLRKVEILLYTGLRRNELFQLQWRDVDFTSGRIWLRSETTKASKKRSAPLFSNVRLILRDILAEAGNTSPECLIFAGPDCRAISFSLNLKDACDRIGLDGITAHVLRHTFSTRANRFGVDPFAQKEVLGHSKLSQTADYTHQSNETFLRNFDGFENHLRQRNDNNPNLQ